MYDNDNDNPSVIDELAEDLGFGDYLGEDSEEDEEYHDHDQLPDVESYKAQVGHEEKPASLTRSICVAVCSFIVLTAIIVVVIVTVKLAKQESGLLVFEDGSNASGTGGDDNWKGETQRFQQIRQYVSIVRGISTSDSLQPQEGVQTAQYQAAQWMADADEMKMAVPDFGAPDLQFDERYTMAALYFSTGGHVWSTKMNFLSGGHICTWNTAAEAFGGEVAGLQFGISNCTQDSTGEIYPRTFMITESNNMTGTIPDEIRGLERLEVFHLENNPAITGSIPDGLRRMKSLKKFTLAFCKLSGTLPPFISELSENMESFAVSGNQLAGKLPDSIRSMTNLKVLALDRNEIQGNIDLVSPLTQLQKLFLDKNKLTGTLTDPWMAGFTQLESLDLSENLLNGSLPPNFFNHPNRMKLNAIDLHANSLTGSMPSSSELHGSNSVLKYLSLHENRMSGTLPRSLFTRFEALQLLDISENMWTGRLDEVVEFNSTTSEELSPLQYLYAGSNAFDPSPLPNWISAFPNLREIVLPQASLTGKLPDWLFTKMAKLSHLDLKENHLTGTIPKSIGQASWLVDLYLKGNQLTGEIPLEISQNTRLQIVLFENNDITGNTRGKFCNSEYPFKMLNTLPTPDGRETPIIKTLVMDCEEENLSCECCTKCCAADNDVCNTEIDWTEFRLYWKPHWNHGYFEAGLGSR